MATDVVQILDRAPLERVDRDYEWLTVSTLPKFLGDKLSVIWKDLYPGVELKTFSPQTEAVAPGISWKIARRTPGKGREDSQKPSLKTEISLNDSAEVLQIYTQYQTVTYEFYVYHHDAEALHVMTEAFESFLYQMQAEVQKRRVENFLFEEELREDLASSAKAETIPRRVLRYTAYVQKKIELSYSSILKIKLKSHSDIIEVVDDVVLRSDKILADVLTIPMETTGLLRVSDLPKDELIQALFTAQKNNGKAGTTQVIQKHIFIENVDYIFAPLLLSTGVTSPGIYWKKNEGSKRPSPGTAYYISYYKADQVKTNNIS